MPRANGSMVAALALLGLAGCIPSNVLDKKDRAAVPAAAAIAWGPAKRADVVGYFESEQISGEAAASMRRVYYDFHEDGTYAGAALVQDGAHASFQVLSGKWVLLEPGGLRLDDGPPAKTFAAPQRLRLDSEGGSVVFHRGKG